MNIININAKNDSNIPKFDNDSSNNKLEINLLDTINNKDLFQNIKNNQNFKIRNSDKKNDCINNFNYLTENYQIDINEIIDENSDINKNELNKQNNETYNKEGNGFDNIKEKNFNENYIDFSSFMKIKKKAKEKLFKPTKSLSKNRMKNNTISRKLKKELYNEKRKIEETNINNIENKEKKIKYSKEKIELNKQRINKLYNDYKNIINKRENMKKELSKEEIKDCSFSPKINNKSKKMTENNKIFSKPIFLRYNDDNIRKSNLIKKYDVKFSHIPRINKNYKLNLNKINFKLNKMTKNENCNKDTLKMDNNIIKNSNILKREILLEEYIRQQKIFDIKNEDISLHTSKTTTTSKSKFSIKKKINSKNSINRSFNYPIMRKKNLKKHFFINATKDKMNKKILKNESFYLDYLKGINDKLFLNINYTQKNVPIISINKLDKYFKQNYSRNFRRINKNIEENVIKSFVDKINSNINVNNNNCKGINYNITEQCMNIKKIVLKNKMNFNSYK